jgi:hypothetical protein
MALVIACVITILYISDTSSQSKDQIKAIKSQVESFENNSTGKQSFPLVGKLYKTLESGNVVIASSYKLIFTLSKFVIILSTFQLFIIMYAFYKNKRK